MAAPLRLATRGSALALAQVELARAALDEAGGREIEVVEVTTQGDRDRTTSLTTIGGQGIFVGAVRQALADGEADVAVHSLKDVPTTPAEDFMIAAVLPRGDARDAFVGRDGQRLAQLPEGARIGTGSTRRQALIRALRPDLVIADIRGNVDTRIRKLQDGEYDGIVLAIAGLERLGRIAEATQIFDAGAFLPAPGQGAIALECRADDAETRAILEAIDDAETHANVRAERGVLAALGTGCDLAVGAYAQLDGDLQAVRAFLGGDREGTEPLFAEVAGRPDDAEATGRGLGEQLKTAYEARFGAIA